MTVAPVAVGIATVDRPASLARCLDALLAGTVVPAEIVVVDQGSTAATREVVEARAVRHVVAPRRGLAASRNAAVADSTAPVLAVTDDDCVPDAGWVAAIGRAFAEPDPPGALTGRVLPLGPEAPGLHAVSSRTSTVRREFTGRAMPWDVGTGANFAVSRSLLERVGGYDERLGAGTAGRAGEDMDMLYRLLRAGARIRYEPEAVVRHERQPTSRRRASRLGYGTGVGAFCGLRLRRRDAYALVILGRWLTMRRASVRDELAVIAGTAGGLAYGLRAGGRR